MGKLRTEGALETVPAFSLVRKSAESGRSYIAWPGQAQSYYMGELAIVRAREKAEKTLGANGADGISDIEGKVARVATSKLGTSEFQSAADEPHWRSSVFGCCNVSTD